MISHPSRYGARRQRGAVAIIFGLTLAVLIGFAGLALDLGRFFVIKSELQNAVDACALAASTQLRPGQGDANALTRAIAYGRVFSTGGADDPATTPLEGNIAAIKNRGNFQGTVIDIEAAQITFATTLGGPYVSSGAADPNTAAFVKCTYPMTGLPIYFMKVLNSALDTQTVSAMAAATLAPSASVCAIPVAVCKVPGTTAASNYGLTVGQWLRAPDGPGSPYGTGNFGFVDFSPPAGGAEELFNLFTESGACSVATGTVIGEGGAMTTLEVAWNSRFGLYKPGNGNPQKENAYPDKTGYGYKTPTWSIGSNAYSGSVPGLYNYKQATSGHYQYQTNPPNPYNRLSTAQHDALGRVNRRLAVAPIVDCTVWNSGGADPAVEDWACVLMLNPVFSNTDPYSIEFIGLSSSASSPCATNGEPGTYGPKVPQLVQ